MKKKVIILIVVILLLIGGGIFWWWRDQAGARELNKNLPEGVRVIKNSFTGEYWADNRIDGFKVKIPREWEGLEILQYHEEEQDFPGITGLSLEGINRQQITIICHHLKKIDASLKDWVIYRIQEVFEIEDAEIKRKEIEGREIVEVKIPGFGDIVWYFFREDIKIYEIHHIDEELAFYIIKNSKW
jgi:hypothetical protein